MGETTYYTATLPFGAVIKLFTFNPDEMQELPPEQRHQRILNDKRVPEIAEYIVDHADYIFSSITVSVDSDEVKFEPVAEGADIGILELPLEAKYVINDGQHRVAGIAEAMKQAPTLKDDTISVVLLPDGGLERSQQIFSDLNRTAHKTSKSTDILFDHRLPLNRITMACLEEVPLFKGRIDKERLSLSVTSRRFATLSGLQAANQQLLGDLEEDIDPAKEHAARAFAIAYWTELTGLVDPWKEIAAGDLGAHEARQAYVSSYALSLFALGNAGMVARAKDIDGGPDWKTTIKKLAEIDWSKNNPEWQGICMTGAEVVTRQPTRVATAEFIKWKLGLRVDEPKKVID